MARDYQCHRDEDGAVCCYADYQYWKTYMHGLRRKWIDGGIEIEGLTILFGNEEEKNSVALALIDLLDTHHYDTARFLRAWAEGVSSQVTADEVWRLCEADFLLAQTLKSMRGIDEWILEGIYGDDRKSIQEGIERRQKRYVETSEGLIRFKTEDERNLACRVKEIV